MHLGIPEEAPEERLFSTNELAELWSVSTSYITKARNGGSLGFIDMARNGNRCRPRFTLAHIKAYVEARELPARASA